MPHAQPPVPTASGRPRIGRPVTLAVLLVIVLLSSLMVALRSAGAEPEGSAAEAAAGQAARPSQEVVLAIHVGTASLREGSTPPERIEAYEKGMTAALEAGRDIIMADGSSVDAAQAAVQVLEDDPSFNAGRGAVFTTDAGHELDASIMDGATQDAGAVTGVKNVKNPITAARLVMDESPHVMLSGQGADTFALRGGLETVTQDYFFTQERWDALLDAKADAAASAGGSEDAASDDEDGQGTVGAVARDRAGNLAAATSTGGLTNKASGRVGDSPIIGAGTWADNDTVAVSGTGSGEIYIRTSAARDVAALYEYRYQRPERSAQMVLDKIVELGGNGGLLVLDHEGVLATPRTGGMPTGYVLANGEIVLDILRD